MASSSADGGPWQPSALQRERDRQIGRARRRSMLIGIASAVGAFAILGFGVVNAPGWPRVRETFFDADLARQSFPEILEGLWLNVRLFLVAEPLILLVGLFVTVGRISRSPLLAPVRILCTVYVDVLRGVPTLLVVFLVAFGVPALGLQGVTNSLFWLALVALVLSYGAYVAEVIRAGVDSIHPSQWSSAVALGLTRAQTLRRVVLPQALRRVTPPLLNDFVSLQKDTALVATIGLFDALGTASDTANFEFNYTPLVVAGLLFVAMTIPLARFTDWVGRRAMERERAGAL